MDGAPQWARVACCRMEVAMAAAVGDLPVVHEAREAAPIVWFTAANGFRRLRKKHPEIAELLRENCGLLWRFN
jgi:hypothetical protein